MRESERGKEGERVCEKERQRERVRKREREREKERERERNVEHGCFIFILKRNDGCLGTFNLSSSK